MSIWYNIKWWIITTWWKLTGNYHDCNEEDDA